MSDPIPPHVTRQMRVRRRRVAVGGALLLLAVVVLGVFVLWPAKSHPAPAFASISVVDQAAAKAAANASAGAAAASEVEQRAWAIGPYATLIPATDGVRSGGDQRAIVALTFDDGPSQYTYDVLAILAKYKVRATFFVLGRYAEDLPDAVIKANQAGHVIANHTWAHDSMVAQSNKVITQRLSDTNAVIERLTGRRPTLFRPPFGDFDARTNRQTRKAGLLSILWSVDSNDWQAPSTQDIVDNVLNAPGLGSGAIILLHDGNGDRSSTVNALPRILDGLIARGLRPVTVPELLRSAPPKTTQPGDFALSRYS